MDEIIKERMLRTLKQNIDIMWGGKGDRDKVLKDIYLTDPNGCIHEDYLGDDCLSDVQSKFYHFLDAVREEFDDFIEIHVDPSYEDSSCYFFIYHSRLMYSAYRKAWDFWWETEDTLVEELYSIYTEISSRMKCARVSKITIKHMIDETPDVSFMETTPEYHYGEDGRDWQHVSEEEKRKVIEQYGSIWNACVAYAEQDAERLAAFNRGDWNMIGIMAEAEVLIPEDTIPGPSWLIQHITSGGLWGIESNSGEEYFAEVEKEEITQLKGHLKTLNIEGADDCPIVKEG